MREAFKAVDARINDENVLDLFQASGCYLVDLYPMPVDRLDAESRRRARIAGERLLSKRLIELGPMKIAAVVRAIADHVTNAAVSANWRGEILQLPYPGRWSRHRAKFVKALEPSLRELLCLPGL